MTATKNAKLIEQDGVLLSWWLAAGIVGADIGTSVFYSTSVVSPYVGLWAPLVIATACVLMWLFKSVYEEGCSVSPFNGGAYMTILQTAGRRWALLVGAISLLSYVMTAAVSALSGAFYLLSAWSSGLSVISIALISIILFAILNCSGSKEPAKAIFCISFFHFGLLLVLDAIGIGQLITRHIDLAHISLPVVPPVNFVHGLAAAFLGISGFEAAAQVVEQLRRPRWQTLRYVYLAIVLLVGITAPITSALSLLLLDAGQLEHFKNSLLSGLAYVEGGQTLMTILVVDAVLVLFAAVNTAYLGAIGLCSTMAKQGDLPPAFLRNFGSSRYPLIVLTLMVISSVVVLVYGNHIQILGEIYCLAFLAVMMGFAIGVILMRVHFPQKVRRAPYRSSWVVQFNKADISLPALSALGVLLAASITLACTGSKAATLGAQIFVIIFASMLFYRVGILERRVMEQPDLTLGLGRFAGVQELPEGLPAYALCTGGALAASLISRVIALLQETHIHAKEIIIFHAEEETGQVAPDVMFELLQRVVSQQVAPEFKDEDIVLSVKVTPGQLSEGLMALHRSTPFRKVFIGPSETPADTARVVEDLKTHLGLDVVALPE